MNKNELKKLALLGMTAGALMNPLLDTQVQADEPVIDLQYVLAKPKCAAHGGCGGLTASRDLTNPVDDEVEDEEEEDEDTEEEDSYKTSTPSKPKPKAFA